MANNNATQNYTTEAPGNTTNFTQSYTTEISNNTADSATELKDSTYIDDNLEMTCMSRGGEIVCKTRSDIEHETNKSNGFTAICDEKSNTSFKCDLMSRARQESSDVITRYKMDCHTIVRFDNYKCKGEFVLGTPKSNTALQDSRRNTLRFSCEWKNKFDGIECKTELPDLVPDSDTVIGFESDCTRKYESSDLDCVIKQNLEDFNPIGLTYYKMRCNASELPSQVICNSALGNGKIGRVKDLPSTIPPTTTINKYNVVTNNDINTTIPTNSTHGTLLSGENIAFILVFSFPFFFYFFLALFLFLRKKRGRYQLKKGQSKLQAERKHVILLEERLTEATNSQ